MIFDLSLEDPCLAYILNSFFESLLENIFDQMKKCNFFPNELIRSIRLTKKDIYFL